MTSTQWVQMTSPIPSRGAISRPLPDTYVLLWAAMGSPRLSERARDLLSDPESELWFSAASIWEIVIKSGLGRSDFTVDPVELRRSLLINGYRELPVSGQHALAIAELPDIHRDPFDRFLLSQATAEGYLLATVDTQLIGLPGVLDLR